MRSVALFSFTNLWLSCVQTSGRAVFYSSFIPRPRKPTPHAVYSIPTFTTSLAHFLYSVFPLQKRYFTPVIELLFHTIHSTYNYTLFGKKNTFIIKTVGNQETI